MSVGVHIKSCLSSMMSSMRFVDVIEFLNKLRCDLKMKALFELVIYLWLLRSGSFTHIG